MTKGPILDFHCSSHLFISIAGARASALQGATQSMLHLVSEPDFYEIFKEAKSLICLSSWIERVLFTQDLVPSEVSVSIVLKHMGMEIPYYKESERRVENTDC